MCIWTKISSWSDVMDRYSLDHLKYIFDKSLDVRLIAEDIDYCYENDDATEIVESLSRHDYDVMGVKVNNRIIGYVKRTDLGTGEISKYIKSFPTEKLISESTPLIELIEIFTNKSFVFVLERNQVTKIVTMADMHKQPIRLLAFSLISLLEMSLTEMIEHYYPKESWEDLINESRFKKALEMQELRAQKNEALSLIECTQFADKGTIIEKSIELRQRLKFPSRRKCKSF